MIVSAVISRAMSKGNQPPRFEEIRRGDPGRDGGGIYRNIARETRIPNILTKGKYSTLVWSEICKLFTSKPTDERVQVRVPPPLPLALSLPFLDLFLAALMSLDRFV